jgi:hypothetical protein
MSDNLSEESSLEKRSRSQEKPPSFPNQISEEQGEDSVSLSSE